MGVGSVRLYGIIRIIEWMCATIWPTSIRANFFYLTGLARNPGPPLPPRDPPSDPKFRPKWVWGNFTNSDYRKARFFGGVRGSQGG